jgi:hypothetical protein
MRKRDSGGNRVEVVIVVLKTTSTTYNAHNHLLLITAC